jgi:hypothetical protein
MCLRGGGILGLHGLRIVPLKPGWREYMILFIVEVVSYNNILYMTQLYDTTHYYLSNKWWSIMMQGLARKWLSNHIYKINKIIVEASLSMSLTMQVP